MLLNAGSHRGTAATAPVMFVQDTGTGFVACWTRGFHPIPIPRARAWGWGPIEWAVRAGIVFVNCFAMLRAAAALPQPAALYLHASCLVPDRHLSAIAGNAVQKGRSVLAASLSRGVWDLAENGLSRSLRCPSYSSRSCFATAIHMPCPSS